MTYNIYLADNIKFKTYLIELRGSNDFDSREQAESFITDYLLEKFKKEKKEVDSTFFDEFEEFEVSSNCDCSLCN